MHPALRWLGWFGAARAANAGKPRPDPPRDSWYAEPAKVFDNVYWVGTKINSAWAIKTSAGIILLDTMYNYAAEDRDRRRPEEAGPGSPPTSNM